MRNYKNTFIVLRSLSKILRLVSLLILVLFLSCTKDTNNSFPSSKATNITIFSINDPHAQINNFSKLKHLVDETRKSNEVILVSAGDLFSGNPVVDNHEEKGFPMIDLMNRVGFDIAVLGNHEFDYGQEVLKDRIEQANFEFICANINTANSIIDQPSAFANINTKTFKISFLGLIETGGKPDDIIPSTHPLKVQDIEFYRAEDVISNFSNLKQEQESDLYIALTHLGLNKSSGLGDFQLAQQFPFFDLIIGGHSHSRAFEIINGIPIAQSGSNLRTVGRLKIKIENKKISDINWDLIDLDLYEHKDTELEELINTYNDAPYLKEVVGYSEIYHSSNNLGCFYTDALRIAMDVDLSFQNSGGIRSDLDQGDITKEDIYKISPFNNGTLIYQMTVAEIKNFLKLSGSGFYYSGIIIEETVGELIIKDQNGNTLEDSKVLKVGINDYIPSVHSSFFPDNGVIQERTAAETLIYYLTDFNSTVNYPDCARYFRF